MNTRALFDKDVMGSILYKWHWKFKFCGINILVKQTKNEMGAGQPMCSTIEIR